MKIKNKIIALSFIFVLFVTNNVIADVIFNPGGNVVGTSTSVDGEIALFSGTTGKKITRATSTGIIKATSGVIGTASAGSDYESPLTFVLPLLRTANNVAMGTATSSANGYLSSIDWSTFNNKLATNGDGSSLTGLTKSQVGLDNVENTALSTWTGSTNLGILGTVGTGTWNATAIGDTYISSASTWNSKQSALVNSAGLASALSDETGTGLSVFSTTPSLSGNPTIDSAYAADRMINGDFGTSTGWTVGAGWAISGGVATHTGGGGTATLSRSDIVGVVGQLERLIITISGRTAGTITLGIGGQTSITLSTNAVQTVYLKSTTTGAYTITPTTTFDGSVGVSIVQAQTNGVLTNDGGITINNGQLIVGRGSTVYPSILFKDSAILGFFSNVSGRITIDVGGSIAHEWSSISYDILSNTGLLRFGASNDVVLTRNTTDFLEMRRATNNQTFGVDETYTDASNLSRLEISATSSGYKITANQQGTGIGNKPFIFNQNSSIAGKCFDLQVGGTSTVYWDNKGKAFWGTVGDSSGSPGNATLNTVTGKSAIAAGQTTMTLTNSNIASTSLIDITPLDIDATATTWKYSVGSGVGTVTVNLAATSTWKFSWKVCN